VSTNTRTGKWGTGAIEEISKQLQVELPGLRGYSSTKLKYMRIFYEKWVDVFEPNRQLLTIEVTSLTNRHLASDDFNKNMFDAFLRTGFTHHREILAKCKSINERWYYILRCANEFWSVEKLIEHIKADNFSHEGALPNNFELTIPNEKQAARAVR
jgi:hypothetical protein